MVGDPLQLQSVPEQFAWEKGLSQDSTKARFLWDTSLFKETFLPYEHSACMPAMLVCLIYMYMYPCRFNWFYLRSNYRADETLGSHLNQLRKGHTYPEVVFQPATNHVPAGALYIFMSHQVLRRQSTLVCCDVKVPV